MTDPDIADTVRPAWRDRIAARGVGVALRRASPERPLPLLPEGSAERGAALLAGDAPKAGDRRSWPPVALQGVSEPALQRFAWLDDLAADGTRAAHEAARRWLMAWMAHQGRGRGPGWVLPATAARMRRMLRHLDWLTAGEDGLPRGLIERNIARHATYLERRLSRTGPVPDRFQAACDALQAIVYVDPRAPLVAIAQAVIARCAPLLIDADGATADRAPETLAARFTALALAAGALREAGLRPGQEHQDALDRAAPVLRALRHADGAVARFHGGGGGEPARLDAAFAATGMRVPAPPRLAMGFARMARGRTTVIVDVAPPPGTSRAHGSTLGFELTSGRRPIIVSCGPGAGLGADWPRAARGTASHSTLIVAGQSSSELDEGPAAPFASRPSDVEADPHPDRPDPYLVAAHNGYVKRFGLIHVRRLDLSLDGGTLRGEELLSAVTELERRRFTRARGSKSGGSSLPFAVRFHLHPDVDAALDPVRGEVRLAAANGEVWMFRHDGTCTIRLDPGVYLENTRAEPVASRQIVLYGGAVDPVTPLRWSLSKDDRTPPFLRETPRGEAIADPTAY